MAAGTPASEFRELNDDELRTRLSDAKEELFNLRFQLATGQLTNNRRISTVKRDIARNRRSSPSSPDRVPRSHPDSIASAPSDRP